MPNAFAWLASAPGVETQTNMALLPGKAYEDGRASARIVGILAASTPMDRVTA